MPQQVSIEAKVAEFDSVGRAMRNHAMANTSNLKWMPPKIYSATNAESLVFDNISGKQQPLADVYIHNVGDSAVKYVLNTVAGDWTLDYHGILAGGAAPEDGLGSQLVLKGFRGTVRVFSASAYKVATLIGFVD